MKWLIKLLKFGLWTALIGCTAGAIAAISLYLHLEPNLPSTESLKNVKFQVPLRVYSADGKLMAEFGEKRRTPLAYCEIPDNMTNAFLAAEDDRFFEHPGVDYQGLMRAAIQLILTGERRQGGSTITMQVARNFFLSSEKTYTRKLNEILLALQIERELPKQQILELYLNKIYLGHRSYGVGAAAQVYYGKTVDQLDLSQVAMIAGLPKAPSRFNPITNPQRALQRRDYVLERMRDLGQISESEYQTALATPVSAKLHRSETEMEAPYVSEMVRSEMIKRFGNDAYTDGYSVYTTIDSTLQDSANRAIRLALQEYDLRHGYRGALQHFQVDNTTAEEQLDALLADHRPIADLRPAIVIEAEKQSADAYLGQGETVSIPWQGLEWVREHKTENRLGPKPKEATDILKPGDLVYLLPMKKEDETWWRLAQVPAAAGALVSVDPNNGAIKALIGGYDFYQSKFNRVTQAKRQPGSGFKAFIYSAALEAGFTPASLINDAPVVFNDPSLEGAWRPENYSGKFFGPTRLRYALTKSRNLVSIRLLRNMGVKFALEHAKRFGFNTDELPHNLSLALGSGAVTPLQMATAYAVLANGGYRVEPHFITHIEDSDHQEVFKTSPLTVCDTCQQPETTETPSSPDAPDAADEEQLPVAPRVISPENHFLMNSMMRDVITRGTARKARSLGRKDLAGKTGTTNEQRDAWFNGFNRSLVAVAWVGFDSSQPLGRGEVGGRAALPAWIAFMKVALENVDEIPLEMPPGMVTVRIDPKTGKRADINQEDGIFEVFRTENAPKETAGTRLSDNGSGETPQGTGTDDGAPELF
ncbi:penicillin-binding protein 1A [Solemya velesiana gill symbiont]|uniref:Penicillin-binding protein 1A n=1 Tax=Solemya velesiana gill symbiont TaxID=1918948 RepID=A0A1T2KYP6_9GAMM|nr:penicillin-binding protein 1A [Solemya velesiana gill symbiont]OOZ37846.1 peptidase [Solemya velesiana gill symbiont]